MFKSIGKFRELFKKTEDYSSYMKVSLKYLDLEKKLYYMLFYDYGSYSKKFLAIQFLEHLIWGDM